MVHTCHIPPFSFIEFAFFIPAKPIIANFEQNSTQKHKMSIKHRPFSNISTIILSKTTNKCVLKVEGEAV
jgi:hypothetical protein